MCAAKEVAVGSNAGRFTKVRLLYNRIHYLLYAYILALRNKKLQLCDVSLMLSACGAQFKRSNHTLCRVEFLWEFYTKKRIIILSKVQCIWNGFIKSEISTVCMYISRCPKTDSYAFMKTVIWFKLQIFFSTIKSVKFGSFCSSIFEHVLKTSLLNSTD